MGAHIQSGLFAGAALPATRLRSTLEMPPKRWLDHWHLGRIDDDTVRVYLERTYSLGVCCRDCKRLVEITPPELSADIYQTGIYLTGGGALLRGLDKRIAAKTKLPVHVAEDPLRAVVRGTGTALKNIGNFKFLMQ